MPFDRHSTAELLRKCRDPNEAQSLHAQIARSNHGSEAFFNNLVMHMYARCGKLPQARSVFDSMVKRNIFSWNILVSVYSRNTGSLSAAKAVYDLMPRWDPVASTSVITAFAISGHLRAAREVFDWLPVKSAISETAMLGAYSKAGMVQEAKKLFDSMSRKDEVCWNAMSTAYATNKQMSKATMIFDKIPQRNNVCWNALFTASAQNGDIAEAKRLFDQMPEHDEFSWTGLITAYAKNGHLQNAEQIFRGMPRWCPVTWNAMMSAYARNGHLSEAAWMFSMLEDPSTESWGTLIASYTLNGRLAEARELFDRSPDPGITSWNALITAYIDTGDLAEAERLFARMPDRTTASWNILINGYLQRDQISHARRLFDRMPEPDSTTYVCMISAYAHAGHLEESKFLFEKMPEKNHLAWTAMLVAHAQGGVVDDARKIFHSMEGRDLVAWTALTAALAQNGHLEEAKQMFDRMPQVDLVSWNAMVAAFSQNGRVAAARAMFECAPDLGLPLWNGIISAYAQNGHGHEALGLFRDMALEGFEPNAVTFVGVLLACGRIGSVSNTVDYFVSLLGNFGVAAALEHYMCVVDQFARTGQLEFAGDLIASMPLEPDSVAWTILLAACYVQADLEQGSRAAQLASSLDPENSAPYLLLSNVFMAAGDESEVLGGYGGAPCRPYLSNLSTAPVFSNKSFARLRLPGACIVCLAKKRSIGEAPAPKIEEPVRTSEEQLVEEDVVLEGLNELANDALQVMLGKKSKSVMDCLEELDEAGDYLVKEGKLDAARFVLVIKHMLDHQVIEEKNDLEGPYKRAFDKIWSCVEDSGWSLAMPEKETGVDLLDDELIPPILN